MATQMGWDGFEGDGFEEQESNQESGNSDSSPVWRARSSAVRSAAGNASADSKQPPSSRAVSGLRAEIRAPRFDYQNAARQAFQNAPLAFADAAVFFDTGREVAVRDFEFLAEMSHLPLQLPISAFERTRRLGE